LALPTLSALPLQGTPDEIEKKGCDQVLNPDYLVVGIEAKVFAPIATAGCFSFAISGVGLYLRFCLGHSGDKLSEQQKS
jgi:hypothetical protein